MVVVNEWMSLDGVVQAPGAPEEDTSGGFQHGGWHMRYFDEGSQNWVLGQLTEAGGFLLGRRTYEILAAYWPNASTTLSEPLAWENSSVLKGEVAAVLRALKKENGGDLHVIGSAQLVRTLIEHKLVDSFG